MIFEWLDLLKKKYINEKEIIIDKVKRGKNNDEFNTFLFIISFLYSVLKILIITGLIIIIFIISEVLNFLIFLSKKSSNQTKGHQGIKNEITSTVKKKSIFERPPKLKEIAIFIGFFFIFYNGYMIVDVVLHYKNQANHKKDYTQSTHHAEQERYENESKASSVDNNNTESYSSYEEPSYDTYEEPSYDTYEEPSYDRDGNSVCHFCGGYAPAGKSMCQSCIVKLGQEIRGYRR